MDVLICFITVLVKLLAFKFPDKQRWSNLIKRQDGKDGFKVTKNTFLCHMHFMETDIRKTVNQWRLKKGAFPSSQLHSSGCYSETKSRKEPKARENLPKKKLTFASSPPPIQHKEIFVEETKFKDVEVRTDFSFVDTPIYFPSNEEAIVNIDHDYSILPSVTNSLASISISFSHFQDKVKQQFEEINELKLKVTNLQEDIETLLSK